VAAQQACVRAGPAARAPTRRPQTHTPTPAAPQSLQAAKLRDLLADMADEKPYMSYPELLDFIKQQ
jgi:hypothetical protein